MLQSSSQYQGAGSMRRIKAQDQGAESKYIKARAVPYALRTNVELELETLEREGIISPVEFSEWEAPIVPVAKPNGTVRICRDYKLTVNQVSKLDNYPIPKTEDLLATLGGGEKFTKLDMSQAYQQMTPDEESRKFTTINTHKGLFQYNRLPFECPLHLVFFRGRWKTSCKAFLRSLCEWTTSLSAGKTTTITLPI